MSRDSVKMMSHMSKCVFHPYSNRYYEAIFAIKKVTGEKRQWWYLPSGLPRVNL